MTVFSAVALLLAVIGVYGVIERGVAQQRFELGVRQALGATRSDVARLVMRRGILVACTGAAVGLAAAESRHVCSKHCCSACVPPIRDTRVRGADRLDVCVGGDVAAGPPRCSARTAARAARTVTRQEWTRRTTADLRRKTPRHEPAL
jgi:hypothetical protein